MNLTTHDVQGILLLIVPVAFLIRCCIDAVMAAQSDLVDIVHTLRQVVCVKG